MSLGRSSLVISLPKDWLKLSEINRGDFVSLVLQNDRSLSIYPEQKEKNIQKTCKIFIHENETEEYITRNVIGSYLNGYDIIKIESKNTFSTSKHKTIRQIVKSLYMRIIHSTANEVTFQTLMDESMASIHTGVERMHIISSAMCNDVLKSMIDFDEDLAKSVLSLEEDVDQFMYFLIRLIRCAATSPAIAVQLDLDMIDCLDYLTLVHRIEHVADHTTIIAKSMLELFLTRLFMPKDVFKVLIQMAQIAFDSYNQAIEIFLNDDFEAAHQIINNQKKIRELEDSIKPIPYAGTMDQKAELCHICIIRDSILRISEYTADIAELSIDRKYKIT